MPNYVVEIEWPLSGMDVGPSFMPSVVVRDEADTGVPAPALDHQVTFTLHPPTGAPVSQVSAIFDPIGEPSVSPTSPLASAVSGAHRLHVELKKTDGTSVDQDEEIDINVTQFGRSNKHLIGVILED